MTNGARDVPPKNQHSFRLKHQDKNDVIPLKSTKQHRIVLWIIHISQWLNILLQDDKVLNNSIHNRNILQEIIWIEDVDDHQVGDPNRKRREWSRWWSSSFMIKALFKNVLVAIWQQPNVNYMVFDHSKRFKD